MCHPRPLWLIPPDSVTRSGARGRRTACPERTTARPAGGGASPGTDGGLRQPWTRTAVDGRTTSVPPAGGSSTHTPALPKYTRTGPEGHRAEKAPGVVRTAGTDKAERAK